MKLKFYLQMLLTAVTALFVATACSDDDVKPDVKDVSSFKLVVSDITATSALMSVTPTLDAEATYYYNVVKKSDLDAVGNDATFLANDVAALKERAADNSMTLDAYLEAFGGKGVAAFPLEGLTPKTDYYGYVYGVTMDGKATTELIKVPFTTEDIVPLTFKLAVADVDINQAELNVEPSNERASYFYGAVKKSVFDAFSSEEAFLKAELNSFTKAAEAQKVSLSEYLVSVIERGTGTFTLDGLSQKTDYYAYVYGIKTDGTISSAVYKEAFTTKAGIPVMPKAGGIYFGNLFTDKADNFSIWMSEAGVTVDENMAFDGVGTYVVFDLFGPITGKPVLAPGTYTVASTKEPNTLAPGEDLGGMYSGTVVATLKADGTEEFFYVESGSLVIEGSASSYTLTAKLVAGGKEFEYKYVGPISIPGGEEEGPELDLKMYAGDKDGNHTDTFVRGVVKSADIVSAKYVMGTKAAIEALGTDAEVIASKGVAIPANDIVHINGAGLNITNDKATPGTAYKIIVEVTDSEGKSTIGSATATTTGGGGDGPALTLSMKPGDGKGENTDTKLYVSALAKTAVTVYGQLFTTESVEDAINGGATYDQIITNDKYLRSNDAQFMGFLTKEPGLGWTWSKLTPGTSYTVIMKVVDAAGKSTTKTAVASTSGTGGGGDEGDATVVEVKNLSHGTVTYWGYAYGASTTSIDYADWEIAVADATYDFKNGGTGEVLLIEVLTGRSATTEITPGTYTVAAHKPGSTSDLVPFTCVPGYTQQEGGKTYMIATWYTKYTSPTTGEQWPVTGGTVKISKSGDNYTLQFEFKKDATKIVKGTYTGPLTYADKSQSAPAGAPWKEAANAPRMYMSGVAASVNATNSYGVAVVDAADAAELQAAEIPSGNLEPQVKVKTFKK